MASILDAQCIAVIVNRSLDVIEYDYDTAKRHKRELVRDFGFPKQQVRLVGFDSDFARMRINGKIKARIAYIEEHLKLRRKENIVENSSKVIKILLENRNIIV